MSLSVAAKKRARSSGGVLSSLLFTAETRWLQERCGGHMKRTGGPGSTAGLVFDTCCLEFNENNSYLPIKKC